ncbi:hypothetical protein JN535_04005 [Cellulosimicrobium cellulans]|uniref:GTP pyrophosphokinase n=1 Tax=Cellulosimicrobium cellulans TaxID=1710 RepID=UPI001962EA9F|nr:hypothetical protein [Cellulosimicrobium cellulans]MBN0039337.1 hypothetical protein [Cellulosimicrobium cellulans]
MEPNEPSYTLSVEGLDKFAVLLRGLIEELLRHNDVAFHSVEARVKTHDSAKKKLSSREKYSDYGDLTDLLGVRVITFFADDVDRAAAALVPEFTIDKKNSVDKRKEIGADRFGYLSLHYVASLSEARARLTENARFRNMRFELQIRSILQHAWAEIEHDLGYKSGISVPQEISRRFSRLAGLLELADDEFMRLRNESNAYEEQIPARISEDPGEVLVDQASIAELIREDATIAELDQEIAMIGHLRLTSDGEGSKSYARTRAQDLVRLGITDVGQLLRLLQDRRDDLLAFVQAWYEGERIPSPMPKGGSLSLFIYLLVAERGYSASDLVEVFEWSEGRARGAVRDGTAALSRMRED